jgi:hypothetical protein
VQENWDALVDRMTPTVAKRLPALFTEAMLAKHCFKRMFATPFFAFPESDESSTAPSAPSAATMAYLYGVMREGRETLFESITSEIDLT